MINAEAESGVDIGLMLDGLFEAVRPMLPFAVALVVLVVIIGCPLPGRGPKFFARRDPWRGFRNEPRRTVLANAGNRCEGGFILVWGRCHSPAQEVDHIYPWSKGGATIVSNGQALCRNHNRSKSNWTPAWWYVVGLERRRRKYYPAHTSVRVSAAMSAADKAERAASRARQSGRR